MATQAALAAKALKQEIKALFPGLKFSVRSENYANGCSVNVGYTDQPPHIHKAISSLAAKYQYGHFDGMNDIYEYTNVKDMPQAKFVFCRNDMSAEMREEIKAYFQSHYSQEDINSFNGGDKIWMLFCGSYCYEDFWESKGHKKAA